MMDTPEGWPAVITGVTEALVTTCGPDDRWNVAALGLREPPENGEAVVARTWGRTRTRRNFTSRGGGYVQFTRDPIDFVEAACTIRQEPDPVLASADAWVTVEVERVRAGDTAGTEWVEWALHPQESGIERRVVPTHSRARGAIIEATVAASRLDVPAYDSDDLRDRIAYFESVVEACGGEHEQAAWNRFETLVEWREA